MSTAIADDADMNIHGCNCWWCWLRIGGAAAILLGLAGIVGLTDWSQADRVLAGENQPAVPGKQVRMPVTCAECGIVVATREISGADTAEAVAAGGMATAGRPTVSSLSYEVTVLMRDGSRHVFMDVEPGNWRRGERMTLIEGTTPVRD